MFKRRKPEHPEKFISEEELELIRRVLEEIKKQEQGEKSND